MTRKSHYNEIYLQFKFHFVFLLKPCLYAPDIPCMSLTLGFAEGELSLFLSSPSCAFLRLLAPPCAGGARRRKEAQARSVC